MKAKVHLLLVGTAVLLAAANAFAGGNRGGSTITLGRSDRLTVTKGKKHNFKQDIEAVNKAHESWKKAHLSETLYSCQRNSEQLATLARRVSDRIEASKKAAVAAAKPLEGAVAAAIGADATEVPDALDSGAVSSLRAKAEQLSKAKKQADVLERLAAQVMGFYEHDMPKESAVDGDCVAQYRSAAMKVVAASEEYHAETAALSGKIDKLAKIAEVAWRDAAARELMASSR